MKRLEPKEYTVGWICALHIELAAAQCMLDEAHENSFYQDAQDKNNYILGRIGSHNVVLAGLPSRKAGAISARTAAMSMLSTFPSIRNGFGLMVGIGGGAPSSEHDIRLGDVVVSEPDECYGGVVQYDYGKTEAENEFRITGHLNRPPDILLNALTTLKAKHELEDHEILNHVSAGFSKYPKMQAKYSLHEDLVDQLFDSGHPHCNTEPTCEKCNASQLVIRQPRSDKEPVIHYGLIASANQVMKHGETRDRLMRKLNVKCFEMEAAGLMDCFSCLVIRGISDYADSHKNDSWQMRAAAVAAAYAKELLCIVQPCSAITVELKQRKSTFMVPFDRDSHFVQRGTIIDEIDRRFETQQSVAIAGIGGVGPNAGLGLTLCLHRKSQIAIEYCYRYREAQPNAQVLWVHASTTARFEHSYKDIAQEVSLLGWDQPNIDVLKIVSKWLSEEDNDGWLLVVDNADDTDIFFGSPSERDSNNKMAPFKSYMPRNTFGRILITTRDRRVGEKLTNREMPPIEVPLLTMSEAELMLQVKKAGFEWSTSGSRELLEYLDFLPLAITQAASYISENRIAIDDYLALLRSGDCETKDLLSGSLDDTRRDLNTPHSVIRTLKVSLDQIAKQNPRAAEILSLMAIFDRQGIPEMLLYRDEESRSGYTTAIGTLKAFSLITVEKGGAIFSMHRLVQLSVQKWLELRDVVTEWQARGLEILSKKFPLCLFENWTTCNVLLPHVEIVLSYNLEERACLLHRAFTYFKVSRYDLTHKCFEAARKKIISSIKANEGSLGSEHRHTLRGKLTLVAIYVVLGEFTSAEELCNEVIQQRAKVLGAEHSSTLRSKASLADIVSRRGQIEKSKKLYIEVIELQRNSLGGEDPDTLKSMNGLGNVYLRQGLLDEAENLTLAVFKIREKNLGKDNPDTLDSMRRLADIYQERKTYRDTEKLAVQVLQSEGQRFGSESLWTLSDTYRLARVYHYQGRWKETEELLIYGLDISKRVLGVEHGFTLHFMENLAFIWVSKNLDQKAIDLISEAAEISKRIMESGNLETKQLQTLEKWLRNSQPDGANRKRLETE